MFQAIGLVVALAIYWWFLSGFLKPLLLILGAVSILFTVWLVRRLGVVDSETRSLYLIPVRAVLYWIWLLKEIWKSNVDVAFRVLKPRMDISPTLFEVEASQSSEVGWTVYGNSITLTPGTVTIRLFPTGHMLVHALSRSGADDLMTGAMDKKVTASGIGKLGPAADKAPSDTPGQESA